VTAEERAFIRESRDQARRARVERENIDDGSPCCELCGTEILDRKPRKRFCTAAHRRTFWLRYEPNGRACRKATNAAYYANRVAA
jgi:hypothetical protein